MSVKVSYNLDNFSTPCEEFILPYGKINIYLSPDLVSNASKVFSEINSSIATLNFKGKDANQFFREQLDNVFGAGFSDAAFGSKNMFDSDKDTKKYAIHEFADNFLPALEGVINGLIVERQQSKPKPTSALTPPHFKNPKMERYLSDAAHGVTPIAGLAQPYKDGSLPDVSNLTREQKQALFAQLIT